jgi:myosin-1
MVSLTYITVQANTNPFLGWWLARRKDNSASGWVPSAYIEEFVEAQPAAPPPPPIASRPVPSAPVMNGINGTATKGKPVPPTPPSKRPAGKKPAPPAAPRDSGYSGSGASTDNTRDSGGSVAGSLAEALRQRQAAMHARKDDDDDW